MLVLVLDRSAAITTSKLSTCVSKKAIVGAGEVDSVTGTAEKALRMSPDRNWPPTSASAPSRPPTHAAVSVAARRHLRHHDHALPDKQLIV